MRMGPRRDDAQPGIVIVTGSCCIPGMAPFDERARRIVDQAATEMGMSVRVKVMPATAAFTGGVPQGVMTQLITVFKQSGRVALPAVLVNGRVISYGIPRLDDIKAALLQARAASGKTTQKEDAHA